MKPATQALVKELEEGLKQPGRWLAVGQDIRDDGTPFEGNVAYDRR